MRDLKDEVSRLKELLRAQGLGDILDSELVVDSAGHNLLPQQLLSPSRVQTLNGYISKSRSGGLKPHLNITFFYTFTLGKHEYT